MRVNYDGPSFGLGKLDDRRVFLSLIHLADIGILKVDGDTSLGWIDLSIAVEDLLSVVPQARKNYPRRLSYDPPIETILAPPGLARDPLSEIWGDLSDADSAGLLADVRAHGVRQPILVDLDKGAVVDGWHRYRMAAQAGGECPAIDVASWPAAEVEAAVQSSNRHRRHSSRKELLEAMARQRLTGEAAPPQTVEQEAIFAGVTKRRYQQVLQATREDLGLAPPNSGGRPRAAAAEAAAPDEAAGLDLERMLELQADTIEAQRRAAGELVGQVRAAAIQRLVECRQLWPGGADAAARLEAAVKALGGEPPAPARESLYALGQRDRRAAVLRFCGRG